MSYNKATSYRSDFVRLPENVRECSMIKEIIDGQARVALQESLERLLRDPPSVGRFFGHGASLQP